MEGCTCFIVAPCSFCLSLTEEEANVLWAGGRKALEEYRCRTENNSDPDAGAADGGSS